MTAMASNMENRPRNSAKRNKRKRAQDKKTEKDKKPKEKKAGKKAKSGKKGVQGKKAKVEGGTEAQDPNGDAANAIAKGIQVEKKGALEGVS